ncbi:MAG: sulfite exporter TauE/SafE family protein, partial [Bacteroidota bacterium]
MDFIQNISSPYLAAILLGLVFVLDPCALLSNIAAIGYMSKDYKNRRQVIRNYTYFALGRVLTLGILGAILVVLFRKSILLLNLQNFLSEYSEITMGVFFIVIGILLIFADKITFLHIHLPTQRIERQKRHIALQSFILGSLISLILCPANIVIFFGILIPLS